MGKTELNLKTINSWNAGRRHRGHSLLLTFTTQVFMSCSFNMVIVKPHDRAASRYTKSKLKLKISTEDNCCVRARGIIVGMKQHFANCVNHNILHDY